MLDQQYTSLNPTNVHDKFLRKPRNAQLILYFVFLRTKFPISGYFANEICGISAGTFLRWTSRMLEAGYLTKNVSSTGNRKKILFELTSIGRSLVLDELAENKIIKRLVDISGFEKLEKENSKLYEIIEGSPIYEAIRDILEILDNQ